MTQAPGCTTLSLLIVAGLLAFLARDVMERFSCALIGGEEGEHYYKGKHWQRIMRDSKFQLCPRGFGRTSYHVMESFQMGLIPIHVYSDVPWVPYADLFDKIGFVVRYDDLDTLFDNKLLKL